MNGVDWRSTHFGSHFICRCWMELTTDKLTIHDTESNAASSVCGTVYLAGASIAKTSITKPSLNPTSAPIGEKFCLQISTNSWLISKTECCGWVTRTAPQGNQRCDTASHGCWCRGWWVLSCHAGVADPLCLGLIDPLYLTEALVDCHWHCHWQAIC